MYRSGSQRRMRKPPIAEINVIPYIDVMLVLLVIFMITAPLLTQGVKVELPRVMSEPLSADTRDPVVVTIDAQGDFYINYGENQDQPLTPAALAARISALVRYRPNLPVLIKGDRSVPYGRVVAVLSLLQGAGVPSVGLLSKSPDPVVP